MSNQTHDRPVHCWTGRSEWIEETYGVDSDEYGEDFWRGYGDDSYRFTCMLPDGHDGPHEWTNDSEIVIRFVEQPRSGQKDSC